jgi:hypothetical protein
MWSKAERRRRGQKDESGKSVTVCSDAVTDLIICRISSCKWFVGLLEVFCRTVVGVLYMQGRMRRGAKKILGRY